MMLVGYNSGGGCGGIFKGGCWEGLIPAEKNWGGWKEIGGICEVGGKDDIQGL
jgi:hypothetical protein